MIHRRLARSGVRVPALGLGTWRLTGDACVEAVGRALELGYRHIDTAQGYGNEAEIGAALAQSGVARAEAFLTTKVWPDHLVADPAVVDRSLERLRVEAVDLLLLHWPSPALPLARTVEALEEVRRSGRARHVGVSNFPARMLEQALAHADVDCVQVEYHPFLAQGRLLDLCRARGVLLTAYTPLAEGEVLRDPTLRAIGARRGKSPAQVALRWLVHQDPVVTIPKAASEGHLRENLAIFDFELTEEEMARIHRLARGLRLLDPSFAPAWD